VSGGPIAKSEADRRRLAQQRSRDTKPELQLRSAIWTLGLRYRVDFTVVGRRRVDIAFTRAKVAVFVDGCFWHACPLHSSAPKSNAAWWATKLEANKTRDLDTNNQLEELGWVVLRVWEHDDVAGAAALIASVVRDRGVKGSSADHGRRLASTQRRAVTHRAQTAGQVAAAP
jgi:DNA mismatch endonuclease (patch repair protein)